MCIRLVIFALLFFSYFCNAMDDDPKDKKELVSLLQQSHETYSVPRSNQFIKFIDNDEKKTYKKLFKILPSEVQKIVETKVRRLYLFDAIQNEFVYLEENPLPYGNKKLTAFDLWQIPRKERLDLIREAEEKNKLLTWCQAFSTLDFHKTSKILPKSVKKGLSVRVVDDSCFNRCIWKYLPQGFFVGGLIVGLGLEVSALVNKDYSWTRLFPPFVLMIGGPIMGCFIKKGVEADIVKRVSYSDIASDNEDNDMNIQIDSD